MNDINAETSVPTAEKVSLINRAKRPFTSDNATSKAKTLGSKAKNVAAVVGVVAVAGGGALYLTKKRSIKLEATLPDVSVTTEDA